MREETERALLEASEQIFAEQGVGATRVEDISKRAGVAVGTLYNYFEDRDGLLAALMAQRRAELVEMLDETSERGRGKPWHEEFEYFLRATLLFLEKHRRFFTILIQSEQVCPRPEVPVREKQWKSGFDDVHACAERLVRRGVAEGALEPRSEELYPSLLLGMLRSAIVLDRYVQTSRPLIDLLEPFRDFFLKGAGKNR
jgi:AcrR family transcriptional regulator